MDPPVDVTMRIFLTGATGYIGSAALEALVRGGHEVTALVRSRENAERLLTRDVHAVVGNLADPTTSRTAAEGFDAYVHAAFESGERGPGVDRTAIETLVAAASARPDTVFVYTSGIWVLGHQRAPVDESAALNPAAHVAWRPERERLVIDAGRAGVRAIVVRPGIVYGGARGIVGDLFKDAANGLMRVIGTGDNHWPLVYDRDLGDLYQRLVTSPEAAGIYHATDDGEERVADIVEAIASVVPVRPEIRRMPMAEARKKMGAYADALALDQLVRSPRARALGWAPTLQSMADNASRLFEEWRRGREAA